MTQRTPADLLSRTVESFGFRQAKCKFWNVARGQVFDGEKGPHIFTQPSCDMSSGSTLVRKICD